jgi:hypothetical protein
MASAVFGIWSANSDVESGRASSAFNPEADQSRQCQSQGAMMALNRMDGMVCERTLTTKSETAEKLTARL